MDKLNCTDNAKEMYIDAVNLEMDMPEIVDLGKSQDCNSASGLQITVFTFVASLVLLFFWIIASFRILIYQ